MAATEPTRLSKLARLLAPIGAVVAGGLAVLFLSEDPIGPNGVARQIAGSLLALLALCGVLALLPGWRPAVATVIHLLIRNAGTRATIGRRILPAAALLGATCLLSFWFQDVAFSHDHAEHCFKAYHFWNEMLGRGRLRGWSNFLGFGYPSGELTPFGPELWVALFRAATLGLLSWTQTYALAFSGAVVFAVTVVYVFTKRSFGRTAGIIAAAVWALDPGGWYQGGWFWLEWLGVWPVTLGMSFTLLALMKLSDVLGSAPERRARLRDVLWAAFWMLASLVTHQLSIVVYAIALPCLLLAEALRRERLTAGAALRFGGAVALGLGLAAFYLVPMFARNGLTQDLGVRGFSLTELAHRLVEMRVFENGWSPIVVLGLFGGVLAIRSRSASGLFFVLCSAIFVLLSSDILVSVFHAERLMGSILKIECQRMLLVAKLFWFPLAAHAAVSFFRGPAGASEAPGARPAASPLRRAAAFLLIAALGAPLLKPVALHVFQAQVTKDIEHRRSTALAADLRTFFKWSLAERKATDEPYRIAYTLDDHHDHIVSISPVFNDTLLYKVGYTSAQQFIRFPMSGEPQVFEALSVKYVLSDHDLAAPSFVLDRTFGHLRLYRFAGYHPRHPFTLIGDGQVELVRFDPEQAHLRLKGISSGARLKLHVARYPRWEATLNGRVVAIAPATVYGMEYPILMEVPAADGDLVFRYVLRAPDWIGFILTFAALALFAALATGRIDALRDRTWYARAISTAKRAAPIVGTVVVGVAVIGVGFAIWKMASPARLSADSVFGLAAPGAKLSLAGQRCQAREPTRWQCGPHEVRGDVVSGSYGSHFCLTAPAAGPLVLSAQTKLGQFLEASYDPGGGAGGRIRIAVDGQTLGETATRADDQGLQFLQVDTRSRASATARLQVEWEGPPLHCFDLRIVR